MVSSRATSVPDYLRELPAERRAVISAVRKVVRAHLPKGYREAMNFGMICYEVPLSRYPTTYNGQPLCYAGLTAQKNHYALYLMTVYQDSKQAVWLKREFARKGKRLDMGKCCVRFRELDDLPLAAIGQLVAATPVDEFIRVYETVYPRRRAAKRSASKPVKSKPDTSTSSKSRSRAMPRSGARPKAKA